MYGIISIDEWRGEGVTPGSLSESEQLAAREADAEAIRRSQLPPAEIAVYQITNEFGNPIFARVRRGEIWDSSDFPMPNY